ncbi:MAG TPA: PilN domain-containing protein [Sedimentisphaerales bacterium]|nr:PilN domain-containing protein [Sedimentisphaerales bacterium]HQG49234.1 PilN domain-containing protein [Sedimentisphaerales bacterium]HQI27418.1 PilN domain-containing protein [Sedimentisphaerales bacterium]
MSKGEKTPHSVIAVVKEDARFKAVEVRRQDRQVEVLWGKSTPAERQTWGGFAVECGVASNLDGQDKTAKRHSPAVVGLDSTGVAFYRISAPAVDDHEIDAIVKMQTESLLPLPPDQIEFAWRAGPANNGTLDITIAAARKEHLHRFADGVKDFRPRGILLACEGTARAWQSFFSDPAPQAVLINMGIENTQACLVQNGRVTRVGVLDMGMGALSAASEVVNGTLDRFAHDLRVLLASFGWDDAEPWPVVVLSDGGDALKRVVEQLSATGITVKASVPNPAVLKHPADFGIKEIYEYRTPLGLALIGLDKSPDTLNLFDRVWQEQEQEKAASAWRSVAVAGVAAGVMLAVLLATVYLTDVTCAKQWDALVQQPAFQASLQQQSLIRTVARHRPDMLELLTLVNAGPNEGVVLDTLHFKKGQAVTVTGQADNMEQMWKFQSNLRGQKELKGAEIVNATPDSKTKKIKFTITFEYREFTKKESAL